jgi:hypothetical protein
MKESDIKHTYKDSSKVGVSGRKSSKVPISQQVEAQNALEMKEDRIKRMAASRQALAVEAKKIIVQYEEEDLWDKIEARNISAVVVEHVANSLERGIDAKRVRASLGIRVDSDKRWKKILAAIRSGIRINSTALLKKWIERNERIGDKLYDVIIERMACLGDKFDADESSAVSGMIKNLGELQLGIVKLGKDLGAFVDPSAGGGGVTIVVNSNIKMPSQKDVDAHQKTIEVNRELQTKPKITLPE